MANASTSARTTKVRKSALSAAPAKASRARVKPVNGAGHGQIATRQRILHVATKEFSAKGYDGARVDDIMRIAQVSKNLIYHYFGSKEGLFIAVLEAAYEGMHAYQTAWPLDVASPIDGVRKLVQSTFKYWHDSPEFIGLLNSENFHKGRHLRKSKLTKAGYSGLMANIGELLKQGERSGDFRRNVDPVELYISISALAYHFLSNRYTLAYLLDRKLSTEEDMKARTAHIEDLILSYLRYGAPNTAGRK
ncbi:TetR family transcriptional regulator [Rhodopseudomonas sp. HC1]|uniref:TetR/AcrR family transcriptional regulator n=1 Tax=Rhodopseudomonas infernalis TaxID=2897386 RepID=UPI001EE8B2F1|nr:TetR/AcrR family transcriptional regulator [Rhodopseudomonas infernalis]MCG6205276.1 TetR family transcriptional regulator [Rhodopseudomonas infernalis]